MAQEKEGSPLRPSAWTFLILSWGFMLGLVVFCFYKIFAKKKVD